VQLCKLYIGVWGFCTGQNCDEGLSMAKGKDYSRLDERTRYVGLKNIANRIGLSIFQLRSLHERDFFPMLKMPNPRRFDKRRTIGPPRVWSTEEWLIRWWMFKGLQRDMDRRMKARARTAEAGQKSRDTRE